MLSYLPEGTVNTVIAKAPTVVLVHRNNPVNDLKLQQLKDILAGKIKNWKEVGGNDLEIKNVLLQPCTITIFSKSVAPFGKDIKRLTPEKPMNLNSSVSPPHTPSKADPSRKTAGFSVWLR